MTEPEKKVPLSENSSDNGTVSEPPPKAEFDELESLEKKYPYPKAIGFIITNEFCERFSFYGMRTILVLYLKDKLDYDEDDSIVIYHVFIMFVYFFPIFGAIIADSWLGRFKTIFSLSIVYALGNILVSLTAMPPLSIPLRAFTIIGLLLVAIGTGGIKPCVSAFGGDQFKLPQQAAQLATFFSLFYFSINAGSLISTFITPILRVDVHCFDQQDCYSLAFGVPGLLMLVSIVVFVLGKYLYIIKEPQGNILVDVSKCIWHAISRRSKIKKTDKKEHWLDYADDKFTTTMISDVKAALKVLLLFVPLPVFWALFDQQGSRWTFQATRMNGEIGSFILKPDQMQVVNPLLILIFIPLFEWAIYPAMGWCRFATKPLQRMVLGGTLAAVAFIISAIVELELEKTYPVLPVSGECQLRIYNGYMCEFTISGPETDEYLLFNNTLIRQLETFEDKYVPIKSSKPFQYKLESSSPNCPDISHTGSLTLESEKSISYFIQEVEDRLELVQFEDDSDKTTKGYPAVRVLRNFRGDILNNDTIFTDVSTGNEVLLINSTDNERYDIPPATYNIFSGTTLVRKDEKLDLGGVYTIVLNKEDGKTPASSVTIIAEPNSIHMLLLFPQYIIITMAEVMFSVTGLEFAFTQAPISMKSVLTAGWLLTVAFGNLIVVIVAESKGFKSQASEFFLFAGLMLVDMIIFWLMTLKYKYVDDLNRESVLEDLPLPDAKIEKMGIDNINFNSEEEQMTTRQ